MKRLACLAVLMLVASLAGPAEAQLPFPTPRPDMAKPQCNKDYLKGVQQQLDVMEKLRASGPEFVGQICTLIEGGSALIGGELPDSLRQQLKTTLGFDVDLRFIKTQCRVGQGNLEREFMTEIGRLKSELLRCNDTI
ncbi:MAG: hypothetical protein ABW200_00630 [Hyphomicrobiaceae bacterium]|jgi:hypothetical protein